MKIENLVSEESSYFSFSNDHGEILGPDIMFRLDVMNNKVANYHKSVVTTHRIHRVLYGTALYTFLQLL